ncbi:MAG: CPBP family intramembrane metalloprotease [Asgard group archaeon]|nr:CPBP family intramembrane metalloprotease [Asgard group archaeon]
MGSTKKRKEKIEESSTWLSEHPWIGIMILLFLYAIFLILPGTIYRIFVTQTYFLTHLYIVHMIDFFGVALFFIIVVPFILGLPNGRNFVRYTQSIRVVNVKPVYRTIVLGLIAGIIILACMLFSTFLTVVASPSGQIVFDPSLLIDPTTINIYTSLTPGIWEEVAFRGIILVLLLKKYSKRTSIIVNGILFGLFHLVNFLVVLKDAYLFEIEPVPGWYVMILFQVLYTTFFGIFLAYLFVKTNSLIPCIITHYLVDAFSTQVGSATGVNPWIYYTFVIIIGFGILPMKINTLIVRAFCYAWPQPYDEQVKLFDTFLTRKKHKS